MPKRSSTRDYGERAVRGRMVLRGKCVMAVG